MAANGSVDKLADGFRAVIQDIVDPIQELMIELHDKIGRVEGRLEGKIEALDRRIGTVESNVQVQIAELYKEARDGA